MRKVLARAPAKLILSGEHAVVYGLPALAMAVNRYTTTCANWHHSQLFSFKLFDLSYARSLTFNTLKKLRTRLEDQYYAFLEGGCHISDVLRKPFELLQYSVTSVLEDLNLKLPKGVEISVDSSIPMGCGMGSSAASIVSTLHALVKFLGLDWEWSQYVKLGRAIENLQHGRSSGIDVHLATMGGCWLYRQDNVKQRKIPPWKLQLVNTGIPLSTTGESVQTVKSYFQHSSLKNDFNDVTLAMDAACQAGDQEAFKDSIRMNHRLLTHVGVVPEKVQQFIQAVEAKHGAAKVCGAGSVRGDRAGIVLVVSDASLESLVESYQFSLHSVEPDYDGTTIL